MITNFDYLKNESKFASLHLLLYPQKKSFLWIRKLVLLIVVEQWNLP